MIASFIDKNLSDHSEAFVFLSHQLFYILMIAKSAITFNFVIEI